MYRLVTLPRKPPAKAFARWVTKEVLPMIRKHGGYMAPELAVQAVEDPAVFIARTPSHAKLAERRLQAG